MTDPGAFAEDLRHSRNRAIAAIAIVAAALFVSLVLVKPAAPKKIVLLAGPEGSAYHAMGKGLAGYLGDQGLEAEVRVTRGGLDNVEQLLAGVPDAVAFAPSETENLLGEATGTDPLVSLGSIAWEPVWLFYRSEHEIRRFPDLAGLKVATGAKGTVVDYIARSLLETNGIYGEVTLLPSEGQTPPVVAQALVEGELDAAFAMGEPASSEIQELLASDTIDVLSLERAQAYEARYPGLARIVAPEGVFDIARNTPPEDLVLLSATTNLVTLDTLYPGTVPLLLRGAAGLRSQSEFVASSGRFPTDAHTSLPLMHAATRYYESGERGLSRYLPYKVTRWLNHLGLWALPLLTVGLLLMKSVPLALRIWGNARLVALFKQLEEVEKAHAAGADRATLLAALDRVDRKSTKMLVPRGTVHDYIDFRQFLHDMRARIEDK